MSGASTRLQLCNKLQLTITVRFNNNRLFHQPQFPFLKKADEQHLKCVYFEQYLLSNACKFWDTCNSWLWNSLIEITITTASWLNYNTVLFPLPFTLKKYHREADFVKSGQRWENVFILNFQLYKFSKLHWGSARPLQRHGELCLSLPPGAQLFGLHG